MYIIQRFKGQPHAFSLTLSYSQEAGKESPEYVAIANEPIILSICSCLYFPCCTIPPYRHAVDGVLVKDSTTVHWLSSDTEADVLERITAAAQDPDIRIERVQVQLNPAQDLWAFVGAPSVNHGVQLILTIHATRPPLQAIELLKSEGGTISTSTGMAIWRALANARQIDLKDVTRLSCNESTGIPWDLSLLKRFSSLRVLNLSKANLSTLPGAVGTLTSLQELRLENNKLKLLPAEIGKLLNLRVLAVDNNELAILPGELRKCISLEEFTLDNNKVSSVLLDFKSLEKLRVLRLSRNPLISLPEIVPCQELRDLSIATLRVHADRDYKEFHVELLAPMDSSSKTSIKSDDMMRPIFALMLERNSGHHPLLAGAFSELDAKHTFRKKKKVKKKYGLLLT